MIKVLFICLGNICRSPLAEAIFNHKINLRGLNNRFSADSCGTSDYHIGELPDERTIRCANKYNISLNHRGRQLNKLDFKTFHYLLVMDKSNMKKVHEYMDANGLDHPKIYMLCDLECKSPVEVPDPYYGVEEDFNNMYTILDEAIDKLLDKIMKEAVHV
ncbi:low molecular weight protein-tyrosine-phosphatase [Anditalea andensis]|uniref:protein-tyrosine-phosphatase n=1 Tax=Anditalea andensis TaxID=1048983 RepID=A0A074LIU1_9BACT|nr:low molecular weight protein-tyrosine-phosphatase [Anditalea andensis]KEO73697.1 protein tyrosine phosphatase [Anditalea andensis]